MKAQLRFVNGRFEVTWEGRIQRAGRVDQVVTLGPSVAARKNVSSELQGTGAAMLDVEADIEDGRVLQVRSPGQRFAAPQRRPEPPPVEHHAQQRQPARPGGQSAAAAGDFHNPYNFIPIPSRKKPRNEPDDRPPNELDDREPTPHDRLHPGHFTGRLRVKMTVITPLLLPDAETEKDEGGHKTFDVRLDAADKPLIAQTAVKGMLRSAYEAITNSRFGIFEAHDRRLGYRLPTRAAAGLIPARVDGGRLHFYNGMVGARGMPRNLQHAAWLPAYNGGNPRGTLPDHEDRIEFFATGPHDHHDRYGMVNFSYLKLVKWWKRDKTTGARISPAYELNGGAWTEVDDDYDGPPGALGPHDGYACITNRNAKNKHDERVFFEPANSIPLGGLKADYDALIEDYQKQDHRSLPAGSSRHFAPTEPKLRDGSLVFAEVTAHGGVTRLFPVMVSRALQPKMPNELLEAEHHPAKEWNELSPADRVFGWVRRGQARGHGAYGGNVRPMPVRCLETAKPFGVKLFTDSRGETKPLPLEILSSPKPEQAGFYVAAENGAPYAGPKASAYDGSQKLRGRKVYPHQGQTEDHWNANDPNAGFRRMNDVKDKQNRSMKGWIQPGTKFEFHLGISDLSAVEVGALLWLLDLPPNHFFKLGEGRPLGFGSVRLELEEVGSMLAETKDWVDYYKDLAASEPTGCDLSPKKAFTDAFEAKYCRFGDSPIIKAFLRAAKGHDDQLPTHYPREGPQRDPNGENYKWFMKDHPPLPLLTSDTGLPYSPP